MTKDKLCIRAAKYAIGKMTLSGSFGFVTITKANEGLQSISWAEVVEWLDNAISRESAINRVSEALEHVVVENEDVARKIINKISKESEEEDDT